MYRRTCIAAVSVAIIDTPPERRSRQVAGLLARRPRSLYNVMYRDN